MNFSLNRNQLKYITIVAMTLDHIATIYFPLTSPIGWLCHFFGRIVGPIMAYFIVEGYMHTSNVKRYAIRLGIFALISWLPFSLFMTGKFPTAQFGVIYSLFLGLLSLIVWDAKKIPYWIKPVILTALVLLSNFGNWSFFDVLIPLFVYIYRKNESEKWIWMFGLSAAAVLTQWLTIGSLVGGSYCIGIMLAPLMLKFLYNGDGGKKSAFNKWFFYIYYPAHLLFLAVLKFY